MVYHARNSDVQGLFDDINLGNVQLCGYFVYFAGIAAGEQVFEQLQCAQHTLTSKKEKGEVKERKGKDPTEPWGDMEAGRPFFFPSLDADDPQIIPDHQKSLHGAPGYVGPGSAVPQAA